MGACCSTARGRRWSSTFKSARSTKPTDRRPNGDEAFDYRFRIDPALVEHQILNHEEDWINGLFLSCRFEAKRKGAYNEYVYNFFKVLSRSAWPTRRSTTPSRRR
jgi:hypothetical protein